MKRLCGAMLVLAACSGKPAPKIDIQQPVGSAGGTVAAPGGPSLDFPPGAVPDGTTISVQSAPDAPPPPSTTIVGTPFVFGPEGIHFDVPVTVTLPIDLGTLPPGATAQNVVVYTAPTGTTNYERLPTALAEDGLHVKAQTSHFSVFLTGVTFDPNGMPTVNPSLDLAEPADLSDSTVDLAMVPPVDMAMVPPADMAMVPPADMSKTGQDASAATDLGGMPDFGKDGSASVDMGTPPDMTMVPHDLSRPADMAVMMISLTSLSPSEAMAGSGTLAVALNGMNLYGQITVTANGTPVSTQGGMGQLYAYLPASMLTAAGTIAIQASNGSTSSNVLDFNVVSSGNAIPTVSGTAPASIALGGTFTPPFTVNGTGFVTGAKVFIGGIDATSGASVTATAINLGSLPQQILGTAGTYAVVVQNPAPGGGASTDSVNFQVTGSNPLPSFTVTPAAVPVSGGGGMGGQLTLTATDASSFFTSSTTLTAAFGGKTVSIGSCPQYGSTCSASLPFEATQTAGSVTISATSPAPGGGVGSAMVDVVAGNVLLPAEARTGSGDLTVVVWGSAGGGGGGGGGGGTDGGIVDMATPSGFDATSVVSVNNNPVTTKLIDMQHVSFTLPAAQLASPQTIAVTVQTRGVTSAPSNFTVTSSGNALPVVTDVNPVSVALGQNLAGPFQINGSGFLGAAKVYIGGTDVTQMASIGSSQIQLFSFPSDLTGTAGTYPVVVQNPSPGGGASDGTVVFSVTGTNPAPQFTVSPAQIPLGTFAQMTLNATDGTHLFTSHTALTVTSAAGVFDAGVCGNYSATCNVNVPSQAVMQAGTVTIQAVTPSPGGGTYEASFDVIDGFVLSPPEAHTGSNDLIVTVWGNFLQSGGGGGGGGPDGGIVDLSSGTPSVTVDGTPVATTQLDPTHLSFVLTAAQLAAPTTHSIAVTGSSAAPATFTVVNSGNAVPVVSAITPSSMMRPMTPPSLTIDGSGFVTGAKVYLNGVDVTQNGGTVTVNSSTQIVFNGLPYSVVQNAGNYPITVQNPAPGGGASNADVLFMVQ